MGLSDILSGETNVDYYDPRAAKGTEGTVGRDFQKDLLSQPLEFGRREIAGLSDTEQQGQSILDDIASGKSFQDPSTSALYAGLRRQSQAEEEEGANALSHRFRNLNSSGAVSQMSDFRADMANQRMTTLAGLYEAERSRDNPYTRLAAINQYGSLPRSIEQSKLDSVYQQDMNNLLGSFQYLAPLAQQIVDNEMWTQPTVTNSPSMFSQIGSMAGGVMNGMSGLSGMFGGGAGAAAGAGAAGAGAASTDASIAAMKAAGAFASFSDKRLKNDIQYINGGPFATWTWNDKAEAIGLKGKSFGLIAQDVERYKPEAVTVSEHGFKQIDYSKVLMKVTQESK